jgi:prepilin peptidase CpaA
MTYSPEKIIVFSVVGGVLLSSALIDMKTRKIPNILTFPSILTALAYHSLASGMDGFIFSLTGMFTGIGLLILPYLLGGAGAGDAKLLGAVGAALGVHGVLQAFIYIAFAGGGYLVLLMVFKRKQYGIYFMRHFIMMKAFLYTGKLFHVPARPEETQASKISYGTFIALGTIAYMALHATGKNPINL